MPKQETFVLPTGPINRRDNSDEMDPSNVLSRENMLVEGVGEAKKNKKMMGSIRHTTSDISNSYRSGFRYYSGSTAKTFAFNNGQLYHIDENGNETSKITALAPLARPVFEIMKVSGNNVAYMADGFNGLYSYDGNAGNAWNKENSVSLNFVTMISHLDRLWGVEEDSENLNFSANLDPTDFTDVDDAGIITIGAKRGAKIQALVLLNETLYIAKEDAWYVLEGRSPSQFNVKEIHGVPGCAARHTVVRAETGIIYFTNDYEFRSFNGVTSEILSWNLAISGDLTKDIVTIINKNKISSMEAVFHNHLYRCAFTETEQVINKMEYIYNTTNQTESLTRGNNVSCYIHYDKVPDKQELMTGRSDLGHIMRQYESKNWDDDDATSTMPIKLETASIGKGIRNKRFTKMWMDFQILGAEPLDVGYFVDTRNSGAAKKEETMVTSGEFNTVATIRINKQTNVTSRGQFKRAAVKGQSIRFVIDENKRDRDVSFSKINVEVIVKEKKRNQKVGI